MAQTVFDASSCCPSSRRQPRFFTDPRRQRSHRGLAARARARPSAIRTTRSPATVTPVERAVRSQLTGSLTLRDTGSIAAARAARRVGRAVRLRRHRDHRLHRRLQLRQLRAGAGRLDDCLAECPVAFDSTPPHDHAVTSRTRWSATSFRSRSADGSSWRTARFSSLEADTAVTGGGHGQSRAHRRRCGLCVHRRSVSQLVPLLLRRHRVRRELGAVRLHLARIAPRAPVAVTPRATSGQEQVGTLATLELLNAAGAR